MKWEYMSDDFLITSRHNLIDYLDNLGNLGWELTTSFQKGVYITFIFKRPKP